MTNRISPLILCLVVIVTGCASKPKVGQQVPRKGDEIMVCGQLFHTGAPVVLWTDPGGYDAYRTERRFVPFERASYDVTIQEYKGARDKVNSPNRYGLRFGPSTRPSTAPSTLTPEEVEKFRGGGWDLRSLQEKVDQFVYHYDVCGTSRQCFNILHDHRGLSVHFMLDVDGTIYQTLDLKERAWHATTSNSRSIGIEIANIGAYRTDKPEELAVLEQWYRKDETGRTRMVLPVWAQQEWIRTPNFVARPIRSDAVVGEVQGKELRMYDLTPQQYESLIKLTAAVCMTFPKIKCDYPRDENSRLITRKLSDDQLEKYQGLVGHFHIQTNKTDPGPAFQWDRVIGGARKMMSKDALSRSEAMRGQAVAIRTDRGSGARPATQPD